MAKGLILCLRDGSTPTISKFIEEMSERIRPDNTLVKDPYIYQEEGFVSYIYNPTPTVRTRGASFLLGVADTGLDNELEPLADRPDGSYGSTGKLKLSPFPI